MTGKIAEIEADHPLVSSDALIWSFDESVLDFADWFDAREAERKRHKLSDVEKLKDGEVWAPVYRSVQEIIDLAEENRDELRAFEAGELAESLDPDDLRATIDAANAEMAAHDVAW